MMRLSRIAIIGLALLLLSGAASEEIHYTPVSQEIIQARLEKFGGKDAGREATLKQMFADAGCSQLNEQAVKGSKLPNVICLLPGTGARTIIVGAHFDHVSDGEGVVDNWSGAALLPSLYQALKGEPRQHTYVFIGFTDEEKGLVGSHFYAHQLTQEQIAATDAMVNMDTLGLAPTAVDAIHADKRLTIAFFDVARAMSLPANRIDIPEAIGTTDSNEFSKRKIPSIAVHTLTDAALNARILHSPKDKLSVIHVDNYYDTYKLVGAYLAYLDHLDSSTAQNH